jgi:copper chaperone CopZ
VSVSVEKIPGIASVKVSLKEGLATIELKPGNTVSLEQVREAVTKDGFTPKDATVTARAEPVVSGGVVRLTITGLDATYELRPIDRAVQEGLRTLAGRTVTVNAVVPAPGGHARVMEVKTFSLVK